MEATVSEIHAYPLRPDGYVEPLFHTDRSKKEILEHLASSRWLGKASEASRGRRCNEMTSRAEDEARPLKRVLASWREVDRWWEDGGVDRLCYLVYTSSGGEEVRTRPGRAKPSVGPFPRRV